ncbi:hypothetical protein [Candidatus Palauibacter sp.]|uniref:hypothetical protein n=1 Tax=Candidatus Palauibacter sp. TaxID=3101350 RepID=UPI003C6FE185
MTDVALAVVTAAGTGASVILVLWRIIRALRTDMATGIAGVRTEMEMKAEIGGVRSDMKAAIGQLRNNDLKHVETRIERVDQRLTAAIGEVREELRGLRSDMTTAVSDIRADMRTNQQQVLEAIRAIRNPR